MRQQRPAVAEPHNCNGHSENTEEGGRGKMWTWIKTSDAEEALGLKFNEEV